MGVQKSENTLQGCKFVYHSEAELSGVTRHLLGKEKAVEERNPKSKEGKRKGALKKKNNS